MHQHKKRGGRSLHQHPSRAARRRAGRGGDTRGAAPLGFAAEDSGILCQLTSNADFQVKPTPQRGGLRPLREQRCGCQTRAPPTCTTLLCSRVTNTTAPAWPPEAEIVDRSCSGRGRRFVLRSVDLVHDGIQLDQNHLCLGDMLSRHSPSELGGRLVSFGHRTKWQPA